MLLVLNLENSKMVIPLTQMNKTEDRVWMKGGQFCFRFVKCNVQAGYSNRHSLDYSPQDEGCPGLTKGSDKLDYSPGGFSR